ncbi:MAG: hypothetical protein ACXV8U_19030 [Methylobacter sp.]
MSDLDACFYKPPTERCNCIIVIEVTAGHEPQSLGMMAEIVSAVLEIPADEIEPAPAFVPTSLPH